MKVFSSKYFVKELKCFIVDKLYKYCICLHIMQYYCEVKYKKQEVGRSIVQETQ